MLVSVCIYVSIFVWTCMGISMGRCMWMNICVYVNVCTCVCTFVTVSVYVHE